jgi:glycosyltransferase involved in cell wall biosynthesis
LFNAKVYNFGGILRILISDYNVVDEMLSGKSLRDFAITAPEYVKFHFVFNKDCEVCRDLLNRGFKCTIVHYGSESLRLLRILSFCYALVRVVFLAFKFKPTVLHGNNLMASRVLVIVSKILKIPCVVQLRNPSVSQGQAWVLNLCDKVYCVSNYLKDHIVSKKNALKSTVVYDGFCIQDYTVHRPYFERLSDVVVIGLCSRVTYQKGVHLFCELAKSYANDSNVIFRHLGGDSVPKYQYERDLKIEYGDCVEWQSYSNSILNFFSEIDLFVLPAAEDEAFGRVVVEAMLAGVPCISTKCGGPQEILTDGVTGFIVEADYTSLKKAVDKFINDPILRCEIGENGRQVASQNFSIEDYTRQIISNYPEL